MPKKSRKVRKKEKELILIKAQKRAYTKHKKKICEHCIINIEGGFYQTYLEEKGDGNYVCSVCGKIFTEKSKDKLVEYCEYLTTTGSKTVEELEKILDADIMPSEFYYADSDVKVICETVPKNACDLLVKYEERRMKTKEETLNYINAIRKGEFKKEKESCEIFGKPYIIFYEFPPLICNSLYCYPYYEANELTEAIKNSSSEEEAYKRVAEILTISETTFENILYKEDCFEYLIDKGLNRAMAYNMTEKTGKYTSNADRRRQRKLLRSSDVCDEFFEWAEKVRYLPSRNLLWKIFEK